MIMHMMCDILHRPLHISAPATELNTAISTIFGVDVVSDITPQRIVSYADKCRLDYANRLPQQALISFVPMRKTVHVRIQLSPIIIRAM